MKMFCENCREYFEVEEKNGKIYANGNHLPYATIIGEKMYWNNMVFQYVPEYIWDDTLVNTIGGPTNSYFIQGKFAPSNLPYQGWKLHISFNSLGEYLNALYYIVQWCNYLNIPYKVLRPSMWDTFNSGSIQDGKFVTLYITEYESIRNLMRAMKPLIYSGEAIEVKGELRLTPHVYARYGSFKGKFLIDPQGNSYEDHRGTVCPPWVSPLMEKDIF